MRAILSMMLLVATGCQTPSPSAPVQPLPPSAETKQQDQKQNPPSCGESAEAQLAWLDGFVVSWRAVLDPANGDVMLFDPSKYGAALDPARARTAAVRYEHGTETIELRSFSGELLAEFEVETFVEAPDLDRERLGSLRSTAVFWWSAR